MPTRRYQIGKMYVSTKGARLECIAHIYINTSRYAKGNGIVARIRSG